MKVFIRMVITIYSMLLPIVYELNAQVVDSVGNKNQSSGSPELIWLLLITFFIFIYFAIFRGGNKSESVKEVKSYYHVTSEEKNKKENAVTIPLKAEADLEKLSKSKKENTTIELEIKDTNKETALNDEKLEDKTKKEKVVSKTLAQIDSLINITSVETTNSAKSNNGKAKSSKVNLIEVEPNIDDLIYVDYDCGNFSKTKEYPSIQIPVKGCVIRSHRIGGVKLRGYKDEYFQNVLEKYLRNDFLIQNVRLNTGDDTRPFEPDIAIIGINAFAKLRIDIEIDEPYTGIGRMPIHCKGEDSERDSYFVSRGWMVIRFAEIQIHMFEMECVRTIMEVIRKAYPNYNIPAEASKISIVRNELFWDLVQVQKWEKQNYREKYLNHTFGYKTIVEDSFEIGLNGKEKSEEKLVQQSIFIDSSIQQTKNYNKLNAHVRDKRITFIKDNHTYKIDRIPAISATTFISRFFPEFDSYGMAAILRPSNPLYGHSVEEIVRIWSNKGKEAAELGTALHTQIEKFYLNEPLTISREFKLFEEFYVKNKELVPFRTEWQVFDEQLLVAGTIDMLARNGSRLEMYDWKRSEKVLDISTGSPIQRDKWGKFGIGKFSELPDTTYNKYCLQQNLYKYIIEKNYGLQISKMYLVVLHPNYDRHYRIEVPYNAKHTEYLVNSLKSKQ